ncbi:Cell surface A33 antigen [Trichinella pseudospiralis]
MLYQTSLMIVFNLVCIFSPTIADEQCGDQLVTLSSTNNSVKPMIIYIQPYKCPVPGAPQHWTKCCDPPSHNCCKISTDTMSIFDINQTVGIFVAVGVVIICIVIGITVIVCCCWEKCPMYLMCRSEAKPDYIASPKDANYASMPTENEEETLFLIYFYLHEHREH